MKVKEILGPTIQGEGTHAGKPAIFVRFSTCNMWSGKPTEKLSSMCPFCDTNFYGGTEWSVESVYDKIFELSKGNKYVVVLSGGEPLLQKESDMIALCKLLTYSTYPIHVETNGTVKLSSTLRLYLDHVTCSPKLPIDRCRIDWKDVDTLKLLYPHPNTAITPEAFSKLPILSKYLQPIDDNDGTTINTKLAVKKVKELAGEWAVSVQIHKILGEE